MTDDAAVVTLHPGDKYRPDGVVDTTKKLGWAELRDEKTRRVKRANPWSNPNGFTTEGFLADAVQFGAPDKPLYVAEYSVTETGYSYLGYDGIYSATAVNQVPDVREWESHLCQRAHDVNLFRAEGVEFRKPGTFADVPLGVHSAETQIRAQNTLQVFRAMIGEALRKLDKWANLLPEEGGSGVFSKDWKAQREGIRAIIEDKVCATCDHPFSAREFAMLHDYSAWRTILDHRRVLDEETGSVIIRVPAIVRTSEPWQPHATDNLAFFGGNNDVDSLRRRAVEWFDEAVHRFDRLYAPRYA